MSFDVLKHIEKEMNNRQIPYKLLLLTKAGSYLYGTNTENSDLDFLGVFIPLDLKYYFGFQRIEEVDLGIKNKNKDGKNTKNAIDIKLYELRKFLKLAAQNNPNIIELLFAHTNKNALVFKDKSFEEFEKNSEIFLSSRIKDAFLNYAKSQLKKGRQKPENYRKVLEFKEFLEKQINNGKENEVLGYFKDELIKLGFKIKDKNKFVNVGNISFPLNFYLKKVLRMVNEKIQAASYRAENWKKYGYDTKFFMHLFRLIEEGTMLIKERKIEFPLKNREFLLEIRSGKYSLEELEKLIDKKLNKFEELRISLPEKANIDLIEKLAIKVIKKHVEC